MQAQGIDVSHFQGPVDWRRARKGGLVFAFVKATQGVNHVDDAFRRHWQEMRAAGVIRGAYHLYSAGKDLVEQARHYVQTVGSLETDDLPPALDITDWEGVLKYGISMESLSGSLRTWLRVVRDAFAVKPILYTDPAFCRDHLTADFGDFPLWLCDPDAASPLVPPAWRSYSFRQYSSRGKVSGIAPDVAVDLNRFAGNYDDLLAYIGASGISREGVGVGG